MFSTIGSTIGRAMVRFINKPDETFNTAYSPYQSFNDEEGSRQLYFTDIKINGEYFKSKNKNNYYMIVSNKITLKDLVEIDTIYGREFNPAPRLIERYDFDPKTQCLIKLEIENNKAYFVEFYQAIKAPRNARISIIRDIKDEDDLINKLSDEEFAPVPN